ncbi:MULTISPECIES: LytTR family DNA-binding domain-containing protein [Chryseobacterium]|uniref:LytTR family DNA-binding domain-containing protein n=1 Tax=Chryseobacterium TaxID=59732 RepID=UPI00129648BA|nr:MULTISPECIES: LytTR family DNA-binding domain-containing protein [Chryseobacterium]MDR6923729.1 DNA-binding LytR/AlgR family response regulator [Chryseobacterium sp. 2987]
MSKNIITVPSIHEVLQDNKKRKSIFAGCIAVFMMANVLLDYLYTLFQKSTFYISESFLFSASYWILFFPLWALLSAGLKKMNSVALKLAVTLAVITFHLLLYPALVWFLSEIWYDHTFPYQQTFNFALSAYFIKTVLVYGFSLVAWMLLSKNINQPQADEETCQQNFIRSIIVTDHNHQKLALAISDILYFSANSPYINIHHLSKKYLLTSTLRSLETQLDPTQFVRIHKSSIINIQKAVSYKSRLNGDYDVTLSDGAVLRISRNYASDFKMKFGTIHGENKTFPSVIN